MTAMAKAYRCQLLGYGNSPIRRRRDGSGWEVLTRSKRKAQAIRFEMDELAKRNGFDVLVQVIVVEVGNETVTPVARLSLDGDEARLAIDQLGVEHGAKYILEDKED